jgi:preprotein translocase subunit SecA
MFAAIIKKIFGTKNDRHLKRMDKKIKAINALNDEYSNLTDDNLKNKTVEFRQRFQQGETLDDLLVEAFSTAREASYRTLKMRHFDVQLIGGIVLHEGKIAEMKTGEGKTLVATLAAYLNALSASPVHVVTVNEYLANRDANWMRPLYEFLGVSVGVIKSSQSLEEKREAYNADITYGTNNEFGFDYLRNNMVFRKEERLQNDLAYAIVDEVDSILIDEARTPLIISGVLESSSELYKAMNKIIPKLEQQEKSNDKPTSILDQTPEEEPDGDYYIDEKNRQVELTEQGHFHVEELLQQANLLPESESLYEAKNLLLLHHVNAALKAHTLFHSNVEYIVKDNQVLLIDEHTGRTMHGRRLAEGIHQAIEAKEGLRVNPESQTLASTTFQNYFRNYEKLSGMTGTADTEAFELQQIYGLEVLVIPTHKPMIRQDLNDLVFLTIAEKYKAIIDDIKQATEKNRPVLVGTASVEASEILSKELTKAKIKHNVLNAKYHDKESQIISQAGIPSAVTIATNMAGRGTDIALGGNLKSEIAELDNPTEEKISKLKQAWQQRHDQVIEQGGLHIIGTERHESRRIDNQLRGRAGRQGDPGSSRFYLSLEDSLMRIFASERISNLMKAIGMKEGEAIEHRMVTNSIEKAQRKVEGRNFDIRKQLLEYDDVSNDQRRIIYQQRNDLLDAVEIEEHINQMRIEVLELVISQFIPPNTTDIQWDIPGLEEKLQSKFNENVTIQQWLDADDHLEELQLKEKILDAFITSYKKKEDSAGADRMRLFEKEILLSVLDEKWKEHLAQLDHLRQGIHLRGYAQKNPKYEYQMESFKLFQEMLATIKDETITIISQVKIATQDESQQEVFVNRNQATNMQFNHEDVDSLHFSNNDSKQTPVTRINKKINRNAICPCGSGIKYKRCCGKV